MRLTILLRFTLPMCLCFSLVKSQNYFYNDHYLEPRLRLETGVLAGVMNALTDLGGTRGSAKRFAGDINLQATHPCGSIFLQAAITPVWTIRVQWGMGMVSGADSLCVAVDTYSRMRYQRNLHFRSRIRETALMLQMEPLRLWARGGKHALLSPYLLAGFGIFQFKPEARYENTWMALAPLGTEGQGMAPGRNRYRLTQWNIPLGAGLRMECGARSFLSVELLCRKLFTDYLDDVSTEYPDWARLQGDRTINYWSGYFSDRRRVDSNGNTTALFSTRRGNPGARDSYFSLAVQWGWVLNRRKR